MKATDQNTLEDRASRFVAVWGSQPGKYLALKDLLATVRREALEEAAIANDVRLSLQEGALVELIRQRDEARCSALEEAAALCDAAEARWLKAAPPRSYEVAWSATVALDLANRIRALKDGAK